MRVLFLTYEYPPVGGGGGTTAEALARRFVAGGDEVRVLTSRVPGLAAEEVVGGVEIRRTWVGRRRPYVCTRTEMAAYVLLSLVPAIREVRRYRPDLLHVFFSYPTGPVGWLVHRWSGRPFVLSLLGADVPGFEERQVRALHRWLRPLTRRIWGEAAAVVANSEVLGGLARAAFPAGGIEVIPNGVDTDRFRPGPPRPPGERLRMVFVGRLAGQKGVGDLLEAALRFRRSGGSNFDLVIVGDGPERKALEQSVRERELESSVTFRGWVPFGELPDLYRGADLYVHMARAEGMPSTVLQAMACGLPVVTTSVGGISELVADGENGFVVPVGDAAGFARALARLASDPGLRRRMATAAAERGARRGWSVIATRYRELYARALAPNAGP